MAVKSDWTYSRARSHEEKCRKFGRALFFPPQPNAQTHVASKEKNAVSFSPHKHRSLLVAAGLSVYCPAT
jgi:hypothetical protein